MAVDLHRQVEVMRMVADDCQKDSVRLDSRPFTPRGVGESLGEMLAMIAACATGVANVAEALIEKESV